MELSSGAIHHIVQNFLGYKKGIMNNEGAEEKRFISGKGKSCLWVPNIYILMQYVVNKRHLNMFTYQCTMYHYLLSIFVGQVHYCTSDHIYIYDGNYIRWNCNSLRIYGGLINEWMKVQSKLLNFSRVAGSFPLQFFLYSNVPQALHPDTLYNKSTAFVVYQNLTWNFGWSGVDSHCLYHQSLNNSSCK
jgi:hypothetical protein